MKPLLLLCVAPLALANADLSEMSPQARALLDAAIKGGNPAEVDTVARYAARAFPDDADRIRTMVSQWKSDRSARREQHLREASLLELVKGRAELGGYLTTGNSSAFGATASLDASREGLRWRHKVKLRADYQETSGVTSREHYLAAYEPNYKVDDRVYVYGAGQFESDHFLGFDSRYSLSVGAGYTAIKQPDLTLDLELGPGYRHTDFTDNTIESSIAARASANIDWKIAPALKFRQTASAYVQRYNSTLAGTSSLAAKLFGPFSAQLSYSVQYESMPPSGRRTTDTTSRASLAVDF